MYKDIIYSYISFTDFCDMKDLGHTNNNYNDDLIISYDKYIKIKKYKIKRMGNMIYVFSNKSYLDIIKIIMTKKISLLKYIIENNLDDFCINLLIDLNYDSNTIKKIINTNKKIYFYAYKKYKFYDMIDVFKTRNTDIVVHMIKLNIFSINYEHTRIAKYMFGDEVNNLISFYLFEN